MGHLFSSTVFFLFLTWAELSFLIAGLLSGRAVGILEMEIQQWLNVPPAWKSPFLLRAATSELPFAAFFFFLLFYCSTYLNLLQSVPGNYWDIYSLKLFSFYFWHVLNCHFWMQAYYQEELLVFWKWKYNNDSTFLQLENHHSYCGLQHQNCHLQHFFSSCCSTALHI